MMTARAMTSTGSPVDCMPVEMPAMITVAGPVLDCSATYLRRLVVLRRVVFGDLADHPAGDQAGDDREEDAHVPAMERLLEQHQDEERGDQGQEGAGVDAAGQRLQQDLLRGLLAGAHQEDAQDRKDHADAGDDHGRQDAAQAVAGGHAQDRGGEDGAGVGFVQVGAHAGHVADVVADVVGDGGRVARVVLGDAGFDLADQVGADVGRLGEDAAADAGEQGLGRSAHAEGQHGGGDDGELADAFRDEMAQDDEPQRDVQQGQADDHQAHDGAGAEGDLQPLVQGVLGAGGGAVGGESGRAHAQEAGQAGEEAAGDEGERHPGVLRMQHERHEGKENEDQEEDERHDPVLPLEVDHGPFLHVAGDALHVGRARVLFFHETIKIVCKSERQDRNPAAPG